MDENSKINGAGENGFITEVIITDEFLSKMKDKIRNVTQKQHRIYFEVSNEDLLDVVSYLFKVMHCRLSTATAMETYSALEILYHFSFDPAGSYFCPRVIVKDKNNPEINSISQIVKGAEWIEREIFDLWGINFKGHPRMEPLLTVNHPEGIKMPLRYRRSK